MTALDRIAAALLGVSAAPPALAVKLRVDQFLIRRHLGTPVVGDPIEIPLDGPLRSLVTERQGGVFRLLVNGQVVTPRGPGAVLARPLGPVDRARLRLVVQSDVDRIPAIMQQVSTTTEPDPDGWFRHETLIELHPDQPPPRFLDLTVYVRTGNRPEAVLASQRLRVELVTVDGFAELVDQAEPLRPAGQTHLEFVASVRRLYQDLSLFKLLIQRHARVDRFGGKTRQLEDLRDRLVPFERAYHGAELIDLGHVLVGIESMPAQQPNPIISVPRVDLALTWSGDLGSVIAGYVIATCYPAPPGSPAAARSGWPLERFTTAYAGTPDLLGDLDGVNLGAAYGPDVTLGDNLRAYYRCMVNHRYSLFLANTLDDTGNPALPRQAGAFTAAAEDFVAEQTSIFAKAFILAQLKGVGALALSPAATSMVEPTSAQVRQVTRYFLDFLDQGLAGEPPPPAPSAVQVLKIDGTPLAGAQIRLVRPEPGLSDVARSTDAQGLVDVPEPICGVWQVTALDWHLVTPAQAAQAVPPLALRAADSDAPLTDPTNRVPIPIGTTAVVVARPARHVFCPLCGRPFRTVEPPAGGTRFTCPADGYDLAALHDLVVADPGSFTTPLAGQNPNTTRTGLRSRGATALPSLRGPVTVFWDESRFLDPDGGDFTLWRDTPTGGASIRVIGRHTWGARAPLAARGWEFHEAAPNASPAYAKVSIPLGENRRLSEVFRWITVHHTASSPLGSDETVRQVQIKHQEEKPYTDVGYHFVIDDDGTVYEGRPLAIEGEHVELFNGGNLGIVLAGDFEPRAANRSRTGFPTPYLSDDPTPAQLAALVDLVQILTTRFRLTSVWTHQARRLQSGAGDTECPGAKLIPYVRDVLRPAYPGPPP